MAKRSYRSGGKRQPIGDEKEGDWAPPPPPCYLGLCYLEIDRQQLHPHEGIRHILGRKPESTANNNNNTIRNNKRNGKWR